MNVRALIVVLLLLPAAALAQGFAGLGQTVDGFATPAPDPRFDFPRDSGPHTDFRIEWWYVTANLSSADGRDFGVQWTLFRNALAPTETTGWDSPQVWLGHFGLTTPDAHYSAETYARGGIGQAGVIADPFQAWIDDWSFAETADGFRLSATTQAAGYDLALRPFGPLVFHGDAGYSVKSADGQASYYYSQPYLEVSGTLTVADEVVEVTGNAWLDREWSSQPLSADQAGWDWFSLSFASGDKLMAFQLRSKDGAAYASATWIGAGGVTTAYPDGAVLLEPLQSAKVAESQIPVEWRVRLPDRGVDVVVKALNPNAWMDLSVPYWEGPIGLTGTHSGNGYLEMTGY